MGHQSYVLLCTETTLSNPPVVQPKSSCDVHLLRSPCLMSTVYSPLYEGFFLIITGVDSNDEIIELVLTESILLLLMLENWLIEVDI